jgi:hypothetical protein
MRPAFFPAMMGGANFSPLDLGAKLFAWWAPPVVGDNIALSGSSLTSWTDEVGGYVLSQPTGANQPAYSASGFNGSPGAEFDGSNDYLALAPVPAGIPTGAASSELWVACRQDAAAADTTNRIPVSIGNTSTTRRQLARLVAGGVNQVAASSSGAVSGGIGNFSGYHVVRGVFGATVQAALDGAADTASGAVTQTTATTRAVVGTNAGLSATYWQGAIRQVLVTDLLTTDEAALLRVYLQRDF